MQDIANLASKNGTGNCRDNATVTFCFLCDLAREVDNRHGINAAFNYARATTVDNEMYNAKISHVATEGNYHHYVMIGDWKNDPDNSYVVDSWMPLADVGLLYSEVTDFKNLHNVTVKLPFSPSIRKGKSSQALHALEIGDFSAPCHSNDVLSYLSQILEHVHLYTERDKIASARQHNKIRRDMHINKNLRMENMK